MHISDRCAAKPAKDTDLSLSPPYSNTCTQLFFYVSLSLTLVFFLSALPSSCMAKTAHAQHSTGGAQSTTCRLTSLREKAWGKEEKEREMWKERENVSLPPTSCFGTAAVKTSLSKRPLSVFVSSSAWCSGSSLVKQRSVCVSGHTCSSQ